MLAYILSFLLSICLIHFNFAIFPWIIFVIIKKIHILYLFRGGVLIYAVHCIYITFRDTFIQSNLQMRAIEAIKTNKREIICAVTSLCNSCAWVPQLSSVLKEMDLKIIQSLWKGFKYAKDAGKLHNLRDLKDFSDCKVDVPTITGWCKTNKSSIKERRHASLLQQMFTSTIQQNSIA